MSDLVRIARNLNLVAPLTRPDGTVLTVHSMPISRETIEQYNFVLARTFAAIFELGVGDSAGPMVAGSILKKIATQMGQWEAVESGLLPEIFRLTQVIVAQDGAWKAIPWDVARQRNLMDDDDAAEVTGAILFFTLVYAMSRRSQVADRLAAAGQNWGFKTVSSTPMEYANSLPTLTQQGSSTESQTVAASVPY
jgi:hypothetical protein